MDIAKQFVGTLLISFGGIIIWVTEGIPLFLAGVGLMSLGNIVFTLNQNKQRTSKENK